MVGMTKKIKIFEQNVSFPYIIYVKRYKIFELFEKSSYMMNVSKT